MTLVYEEEWLAAKAQIDRVIAYAYERERIEAVAGLIAAVYAWQRWMAVRYAYRDAETRAHWRDWDWGG